MRATPMSMRGCAKSVSNWPPPKQFMGAILISGIDVGDSVYISAGSVVYEPVPNNTAAIGMPARFRSSEAEPAVAELQPT